MKRRKFIISGMISLAGLSILSFPLIEYVVSHESYPLLQRFLPKETITTIGIEYLKVNPAYKSEYLASIHPKQLAELVKEDFENDRIVIVDRWVLSITEAQYCATLHIQNQ